MIPFKSPLLLTVPPTLEKRLEALAALRTLQAQDEALYQRRRAAIAALRRDFDRVRPKLEALIREFETARPELRRLLKYSPDQPRVPAGQSGGGQWTSEDSSGSSPDSMARPVAEEHPSSERGPQYAALQTDTRTDAADGPPPSQQQRPKDDDAGAAESGGKFENGAPLFSGSLHDKVMQAWTAAASSGDYDDLTQPGYHSYATGWDRICATGDSCTLENARLAVLAYQVPGYNGMTEGGGQYPVTLPGGLYIGDVQVIDNGTSINNETLLGHALYYGYITNTLEVRPDGIYVRTIGEGLNTSQSLADINAILGPMFFSQQHVQMRQYFNTNFNQPQ
jgi:hypothetical protein